MQQPMLVLFCLDIFMARDRELCEKAQTVFYLRVNLWLEADNGLAAYWLLLHRLGNIHFSASPQLWPELT